MTNNRGFLFRPALFRMSIYERIALYSCSHFQVAKVVLEDTWRQVKLYIYFG